jgi:hypothetical protein
MFLEARLANPKQAHSFEGLFWISSVRYGGSPPSPPPPPPPPEPPNYAAANAAAVEADIRSLPARREVENLAKLGGSGTVQVPKYSKDGTLTGYDAISVDFRGKSDVDVAKEFAKFQRQEADINAANQLALSKKYASEYAGEAKRQLRELDPTGYAVREQLGRTLTEELSAGQQLTPDEERRVTQTVRGAQVARGNIYGGAPIAQEAIARYGAGVARQQQRMANVQSYLGLNPIVAQAGGLSALQQGATPYIQTPIPQGVGINPAAGQIGTNFALGVYGNQTSQYNALLDYNASIYNTQTQYASQNSPLSYITGIGSIIPKFI